MSSVVSRVESCCAIGHMSVLRVSVMAAEPASPRISGLNDAENTNDVEKCCILLIIGSIGTSLLVVVLFMFFGHLVYNVDQTSIRY